MSSTVSSHLVARCEELEFQLSVSRKMEKANVALIEEQYQTIVHQAALIHNLEDKVEDLEFYLEKENEMNVRSAADYSQHLESLRIKNAEAEVKIEELQKKTEKLTLDVDAYKQVLRFTVSVVEGLMNQEDEASTGIAEEDIENFPNDLLEQFSKLKVDQDCETALEDELFKKELAKRMTCKICLSEVERLRCSQCLKGICKDCHSKVDSCPHCRCDKQKFEPIIMSRI